MKNLYLRFFVLLLLMPLSRALAQENWETLNKNSMDAYKAKDFYEGAFNYTQQAITQAAKEYGIESPRYALSASNLAYMYAMRKAYTDAATYYLKAISIRQKLNLEADYAISVSQYAIMLHKNLKDLVNAEKYLLLARDVNRKLYTENSSQYYEIAIDLGALYFETARYTEAEPYFLYKRETARAQKGANSEDYAVVLKDLMNLYNKYADKTKYLAVYEELLQVLAAMGYDNDENYFAGMFSLAGYYEQLNNIPKAVATYNILLPAIKKTMGDTSALYIGPMVKLISIFSAKADYYNMSNYSIELMEILKRKPGARDAYITGLDGVSAVFQMTGDYVRAEQALTELSAALKKDKGPGNAEYLLAMRRLGDVELNLGKHKEAIQSYREALLNRGQKDMEYAADLTKTGYVLAITGKLEEAERDYDQALQLFKTAQKEQTNEYAVLLNYLGSLYASTGRADEGEALLLKARDIYAATVGTHHQNYAIALSNLAGIYMNKGNYNLAEQLLLNYLDIQGEIYGKQHPEYAFALVHLALFYKNMGNTEKWENYLLNALDIQQKTLPPGHPSLMTTFNNLAVFYNNTDQFEKAEPFYLQSLELSSKILGERADYLNTLTNLAGLYVNLKDFEKATTQYNKALALAKKLYGEGKEYANVLQGLALMYDYKGAYQQAGPYFLQALAIKKKTLPATNPTFIQLNLNIGRLYQAMHNYAKAEPYYAVARNLMLDNIDKGFAFLSESEKQDFLSTLNYRFELLQNFYLSYQPFKNNAGNQAFDTELATKGLTLNSAIEMRKAIAKSNNADALKIYDEWMRLRAEIAKGSTADTVATLQEKEARATGLEKQLTRLSGTFNEGRVLSKATLNDIKQKLGDNDVAIEFASFRRFNDTAWTDSVIYVAILLRRQDTNATIIRLCESGQLNELIRKKGQDDGSFVSSLYSSRGIEVDNANNSLANGKKLYELIWKPIDGFLKPGNKIYFAPSGVLHQIAFAAIPYPNGKLLSDQYKLSQLSSTAMLLKDAEHESISRSITLFGGIKYDLNDSVNSKTGSSTLTAAGRGSTWSYLPGTLTEAENIARMAETAKYTTKTFLGENGLEEHMKEVNGAQSPGIIHIASHGFFFPDPELNYKTDASGNVFSRSSNPMNRSGMLFAGANAAWKGYTPAKGDDGILTAYEASNLSLANTSLVVLSACETGLGDIKGNEGVYGLQRSFKMAGVNYLVMSLWKVPDTETSEFMQQFYTGLFNEKGIENAFTAAQDTMKKKYPKEPYKWAAFILIR